jgi:predicted enzyme related to lactoylglutathione lyase
MTAKLKDSAPCFLVADVRATAEHYRDVLGFCFEGFVGEPASFCMLSRDGATIVLQRGDARPNGREAADAFLGVTDVKSLAAELVRRGAEIVLPPTYRPIYDGWEMSVRDCDGRLILFTQAD